MPVTRGAFNPRPTASRESTASLLMEVRRGLPKAGDRLVTRYLGILQRWAHGRIPRRARNLVDTGDIVQSTLLRALGRVTAFEPRRAGAFLAYLRRILLNQISDQVRRSQRQPATQTLSDDLPGSDPSPLEHVIGRETLQSYENALAGLPGEMQGAVILRLELGLSHEEVARTLGAPSPDAARMLVARAMARLAEVMSGRR